MLSDASLREARGFVTPSDPAVDVREIRLERDWDGPVCRSRLVSEAEAPVNIQEVVLFAIAHDLTGETAIYGEGFQKLSQTGGTLAQPVALGGYTDAGHYRIPEPEGATTLYSMLALSPPRGGKALLAFTSCRRFAGRFYLREGSIEVVLDTEGLAIGPGETWELEEFMVATGTGCTGLKAALAERIDRNHSPLRFEPVPAGWCSWYCFGPGVTADDVLRNLDFIAANLPELRYIQIDDGYQAAMGDWLETGNAFEGAIREVLDAIRRQGFEPALWVAPFVAEEGSHLFGEHPEWFVKDREERPLRSDRVTFGGWRRGPWYALDGTHPGAQEHLESLFRALRRECGCTYFKLDACFWGAMHGGRFHDPTATRIEAYRRGMQAIARGAEGAFILGCNHPVWPSLGLIHGSRSSNDIGRTWESFRQTGRENLLRAWQNGRLWWNDPDCVVLTGDLSEQEFTFHATVVLASGGMVLSGDDLTKLPPERLAVLRELVPPTGVAARFEDESMRVGSIKLPERRLVCLFNWEDEPITLELRLDAPSQVRDFWTGEHLGVREGIFEVRDMPGRSAKVLDCRPPAA